MSNKTYGSNFNILSIDTSCDETSASVTKGVKVLSNIIWSQSSLHAKFGGVYPSLAKRSHEERIDWVINNAIQNSKIQMQNVDAIAVTVGPGLAVALEDGIRKAKELCTKYKNGLNLWVVSDNLRKGAALNAIQIAECLVNG